MPSKPKKHRLVAVLKVPRQTPNLINYARRVVTDMTNNPFFPKPAPSLAEITSATNDLEAAEAQALKRAHGAAATRDDKRSALVAKLEALRGYVQNVADADSLNAATIITSASMSVRKASVHQQRVFTLQPGPVAGSVKARVPSAAPRAAYDWQYSGDAGKTWIALPTTVQTRTTLSGLPPGTYLFRFRVVTRTGTGDWSSALSITLR
jgi:hypothetical protein